MIGVSCQSPQIQGAPEVGCCSAMPGQHGTGPVPPAAAVRGSWLGLPPRMPRMQSERLSFPLLFLPPLREQDMPCPGKPESHPLMGKPQGMWGAMNALALGWTLSTGSLGGWHCWGHRGFCVDLACVDDLLCAECFMDIHTTSEN